MSPSSLVLSPSLFGNTFHSLTLSLSRISSSFDLRHSLLGNTFQSLILILFRITRNEGRRTGDLGPGTKEGTKEQGQRTNDWLPLLTVLLVFPILAHGCHCDIDDEPGFILPSHLSGTEPSR